MRRWQANVSYMHYGSKEPGGNALQSFAGSSSSCLLYRKVDSFAVNNIITVSPTMIVTAGYGFNRFPNNTLDISNGFDQATLGFPSSYVSALQKKAFPQITNQSLATEGTLNSGPAVFYSRNVVLGVSKSLGKHELKAGYVYRSISVTFTNVGTGNGRLRQQLHLKQRLEDTRIRHHAHRRRHRIHGSRTGVIRICDLDDATRAQRSLQRGLRPGRLPRHAEALDQLRLPL